MNNVDPVIRSLVSLAPRHLFAKRIAHGTPFRLISNDERRAFARSRHVKCDESMSAGEEGGLLPAIARAFGSSIIIGMAGRGNRRAIKPLAAALTMQIEFIPQLFSACLVAATARTRRGRKGTGKHVRLSHSDFYYSIRVLEQTGALSRNEPPHCISTCTLVPLTRRSPPRLAVNGDQRSPNMERNPSFSTWR